MLCKVSPRSVHSPLHIKHLATMVPEEECFLTKLLVILQWGVFALFACCVFLMTLSVYLFFPETKGIPIEDCPYVFKHHWYWKK